jgi:SpoIID/LytB domain protein
MEDYLNAAIYYGIYGKMVTTSEVSASSLANLLSTNNKQSIKDKVGTITNIQHVYDVGGSTIVAGTKYTKSIQVTGSNGTVTINGTAFKIAYNVRAPYNNAVYSTLYDIKKVDSNNWELWTRGFGHRVGMSQYGAKGRADAGQGYESILQYYYAGANVVQYDIGRNVRVALIKVGSRVMKVTSKSEITIYEGGNSIKIVPANTEIRVEYN